MLLLTLEAELTPTEGVHKEGRNAPADTKGPRDHRLAPKPVEKLGTSISKGKKLEGYLMRVEARLDRSKLAPPPSPIDLQFPT